MTRFGVWCRMALVLVCATSSLSPQATGQESDRSTGQLPEVDADGPEALQLALPFDNPDQEPDDDSLGSDIDDDDFGDDDVDGSDDGDAMIEQIVQEVFLGTVVYPQERGEWQFTFGYLQGAQVRDDAYGLLEVEYGITDRLQLGVELPLNFYSQDEDTLDGLGSVGFEVFHNLYNDPRARRAFSMGYEFGLPVRSGPDGERRYIHEPFAVFYQEIGLVAFNFSAGLEVEDSSEETEVGGEMAWAAFREYGNLVPLLELGIDIEEDSTPIVLAPGMFWKPRQGIELGSSLSLGLSSDAPDFGVSALVILEFGGADD